MIEQSPLDFYLAGISADYSPFKPIPEVTAETVNAEIDRNLKEIDEIIQQRPEYISAHPYRAVKRLNMGYVPCKEGDRVPYVTAILLSEMFNSLPAGELYHPNLLFTASNKSVYEGQSLSTIYLTAIRGELQMLDFKFKPFINFIDGPHYRYRSFDTRSELLTLREYIYNHGSQNVEIFPLLIVRAPHAARVRYLAEILGMDLNVLSVEAIMIRQMAKEGMKKEETIARFRDLPDLVRAENNKLRFMENFDPEGKLLRTFAQLFPKPKDWSLDRVGNGKF